MKSALKVLGMLGALVVSSSAVALPVGNLGFESGLTGYTTSGAVSVVSSATANDGTIYSATEGSQFALLDGSAAGTGMFGGTGGAILSTAVSFDAGDSLSFNWAFLATDYLPFNDFSLFIADIQYKLSDIVAVGSYGDTGWQSFSWTAASAFSGSIAFVSSNLLDSGLSPKLLIDNLQVNANQVPEASTIALFGMGLLGFGMARRRVR